MRVDQNKSLTIKVNEDEGRSDRSIIARQKVSSRTYPALSSSFNNPTRFVLKFHVVANPWIMDNHTSLNGIRRERLTDARTRSYE